MPFWCNNGNRFQRNLQELFLSHCFFYRCAKKKGQKKDRLVSYACKPLGQETKVWSERKRDRIRTTWRTLLVNVLALDSREDKLLKDLLIKQYYKYIQDINCLYLLLANKKNTSSVTAGDRSKSVKSMFHARPKLL